MATVALETSTHSNVDGTTYNTASITVTGGDLLVCSVSGGLSGGGGVFPTQIVGALGSTLQWTMQCEVDYPNNQNANVSIWTAPVPADASGVLTYDYDTTTMSNLSAHAVSFTPSAGYRLRVRQSHTFQATAANPSGTFPSSVLSSSCVFAAMSSNESVSITAGSGYTLIGTQSARATPTQTLASEYDLTASDTIAFTVAGVFNRAIAAIEIQEIPIHTPRRSRHLGLALR